MAENNEVYCSHCDYILDGLSEDEALNLEYTECPECGDGELRIR